MLLLPSGSGIVKDQIQAIVFGEFPDDEGTYALVYLKGNRKALQFEDNTDIAFLTDFVSQTNY